MALIAVLEASEAPGKSQNRERRQLVCVANTHVHSNPELTDVKLWQVRTRPWDDRPVMSGDVCELSTTETPRLS